MSDHMMQSPPSERLGREGAVIFLILWAAGVGATAYMGADRHLSSCDAIVRCGVGRDLLEGLTRGRQGFVGSLRWAPLPTLLVLPFLRMPGAKDTTFAASIVSAASAAMLAAMLSTWFGQYGMRRGVRIPLAFAYFLSPPVMRSIFSGSSEQLFVLLVGACVCFLLHWLETETLRSLAYLAICLALTIVTRYQAVLLVPIFLLCVLGNLVVRHKGEAYSEGTLVTFLTPTLYLVGLWFGANWLIMGDAMFAVRGLPLGEWSKETWCSLAKEGCEWGACVAPALMAGVGWVVGLALKHRKSWLSFLPPAFVCAMLLWLPEQNFISRDTSAADTSVQAAVELLNGAEPSEKFVVSGYRGYELAYHASLKGRDALLHTLSFYLDQTLERTVGWRLYLLTPVPIGLARWEDIGLKFPDVYHRGTDFTLFETDIPGWRVWRIVRIDEPK